MVDWEREIHRRGPEGEIRETPPTPPQGEGEVLGRLPFQRGDWQFSEASDFHRGPRNSGRGRKLVVWSFAAALIDALSLLSLSCFFVVGFHLLTGLSLQKMLPILHQSFEVLGICGAVVIFFFMSVQRIFMGHSLGEWACGLRLGDAQQRLSRYYSLKVLLRMTLVALTGGVVFPFLSLIFARDVLGLWIRLPLVKLSPSS